MSALDARNRLWTQRMKMGPFVLSVRGENYDLSGLSESRLPGRFGSTI